MKTTANPTIFILYSNCLDPIFTGWVKSHEKWKDIEVPSKEEVLERIQKYKEAWQPKQSKVLQGLNDATGIEFLSNFIIVHIVSLNPRQFSFPIVIKSRFDPDEFVDVLTHELVHKLQDEDFYQAHLREREPKQDIELWRAQYPDETNCTQTHIFVFAVLKYIFCDVLQEEYRLERAKEKSRNHSTDEYTRAWELMEEKGYKNVLEEVREFKKDKNY